jgi:hypothetical protein
MARKRVGRGPYMTNESWRAAWELYRSARELPTAERDILLQSMGANPEVLREVVALLDEPEEPGSEVEHDGRVPLVSLGTSRYEIGERLGARGCR